jgi:hypothetical protein
MKSYDCAMWMREECGIETLKESLDYSQKQNSQAQAEIVGLKKDLARARELLHKAMPYVGAEYGSAVSKGVGR